MKNIIFVTCLLFLFSCQTPKLKNKGESFYCIVFQNGTTCRPTGMTRKQTKKWLKDMKAVYPDLVITYKN